MLITSVAQETLQVFQWSLFFHVQVGSPCFRRSLTDNHINGAKRFFSSALVLAWLTLGTSVFLLGFQGLELTVFMLLRNTHRIVNGKRRKFQMHQFKMTEMHECMFKHSL